MNASALATAVAMPSHTPQTVATSSTASRYTTPSDTTGATSASAKTISVVTATDSAATATPATGTPATRSEVQLWLFMRASLGQSGSGPRYIRRMPELPEVEITARRLHRALAGARVESALAPGMVTMKTYDPPLSALAGREVTGVRRIGKMPVVEFGDLALLVHLMSAGRLQLFDKRASLRDKASRLLIRLDDGRELRLREFGTRQRAWAKLLPRRRRGERRGCRDAGARGAPGARRRSSSPRRCASRGTCTRCCATSA